jgi:hypothetical protein
MYWMYRMRAEKTREVRTNMLRQDRLRTLKHTHQTASTVMPLVTAGLALMSALIAAQERRTATSLAEHQQPEPLDLPRVVRVTTPRTLATPAPTANLANPTVNLTAKSVAQPRERRASLGLAIGSAIRYLATFLGICIKVIVGAIAVIAIVVIYEHLEKTNRAVLLTVLVVSVLYLTARVARSHQKRSAGR